MDALEETTSEGASGEPETVADGSRSDDALLSSLEEGKETAPSGADDEFLKKLESFDPGALPESLRRKLEAPFLSNFTQKTTAFDREKQQLLSVIDRLSQSRGPQDPAAPDPMVELQERVKAGDTEAILDLVRNMVKQGVQEQTGPQMTQLARERAIRDAAQMNPHLSKYEKQVAEDLMEDQDLLRLTQVDGHKYASRILAGLGWRRQAIALESEVATMQKNVDSRVKQGIEDYKRKLAGLPPSTSQAGKTPSVTPTSDEPSLRDAMNAAWKESGLQG